MEHKRAAHRVAVIGKVHQKPGRARAYQSHYQTTAQRKRYKAFKEGRLLGRLAVLDRATALTEQVAGRGVGVIMLTDGQEIARAFGHMPPHLEHS